MIKVGRLYAGASPWLALGVVLLIFAALAAALVREGVQENLALARQSTQREVELIAEFVTNELRAGRYQEVGPLLSKWGATNAGIHLLKLHTANGFELAQYRRAGSAKRTETLRYPIRYSYRGQALLELVVSYDAIYRRQVELAAGLAALLAIAGVLLTALLHFALVRRREARALLGRTQELEAARKELTFTAERLNLTLDGINDGVWDWNPQTNELYLSPRWKGILGYADEELPSAFETWERHVHPADKPHVLDILQKHFEAPNEGFDVEYRMLHKNGTWIWVQVRGRVAARDAAGRPQRMLGTQTDISARKTAEIALRASEARIRQIFEQADDAIFVISADNRFLNVNPRGLEMTGYAREEFLRLGVADILSDQERARLAIEPVDIVSGKPHLVEWEYRRKDGSTFQAEVSARRLDDQSCLAIVRDLTERNRSHATIREYERRFRSTLENIHLLAVALDVHGSITFCNNFLLDLTGWRRDEVIGKNWFEFFLSDAADDRISGLFQRAMATGAIPLHYENEILTRNRERLIVRWNNTVLHSPDGHVIGTVSLGEDVTESRRAQNALLQSEQRLRDLIDGLGPYMLVGLLDTDGVVLEVNRPALAAADLNPDDVLGQRVEDTYWWTYSEAVRLQLRTAIARAARGEGSRYDVQVRAANDTFMTIDFSVQPMRDAEGRVAALVASAIVISERKRAEEALRESEERLRLALDAAHMGIFDWDMPNERITWSHWHEELWGFKPGEFDGSYHAFATRIHPDDLPGIEAEIGRCIADREGFSSEFRVIWPDDSVHWIAGRGEFTFAADGKPLRMRGTVMEITEGKQAEAALQESEARYRMLFDCAPDGIIIADREGRCFDANPAMCRMVGYSHDELAGMSVADIVSTEEVVYIAPGLGAIETGEDYYREWQLRRSDGSTFAAEVVGTQMPDGSPLGIIRDITERKRVEQALQQMTRELERRVDERTQELQTVQLALHAKNMDLAQQNRQVEAASRFKSEFLANMSHELRTPLNAIIGFSELMHDGRVGPVSAEHKEYLGDVLSSSRHLLQLINDVLDLAKVEAGKLEFRLETIDLARTLDEVRDVIHALVLQKHLQISVEIDPQLNGIVGDVAKLKQILYNFLSNAIKFSHQRGIISVRVFPQAAFFRIEVEDHGIGIKNEDQVRLFEEFQQLDIEPALRHTGTGLGLALTKRLAEAQGGYVGVSSVHGEGSIFFAVLPRVLTRELMQGVATPWPHQQAAANQADAGDG